jgi:acetyl/propionyl-CoA carboxylase alpha subunit/acetyl-CoA carboxylase carboxyltransferase component
MNYPFSRIAVVNRGEAGVRFMAAVASLRTRFRLDITSIALYTEPDADSAYVREADETFSLGPAVRTDGRGVERPAYLDLTLLESALVSVRADAVWVGWGFVSENAEFARLCERLDVAFIGPSPAVLDLFGDKIRAKSLAEAVGVPVLPWSGGPVDSESALDAASAIGYPLLVKAAYGAGGRGIRTVREPNELLDQIAAVTAEAGRVLGAAEVFLESVAQRARHVEVQIAGDACGHVHPIGLRDCTAQRRNQKVLEECPPPGLSDQQQSLLAHSAVRIMQECGFVGVGTVEFLYLPDDETYYFLEVNPRLQVEHPVTELVHGVDLVVLQLQIAAGVHVTPPSDAPRGHAIEARLNAEDPNRGFTPSAGRIAIMTLSQGPGIRIDTGYAQGDSVPAEFDSMIAKIVATGSTREEAIGRLSRALATSVCIMESGASNRGFLHELVDRPEFRAGEIDTKWIEREVLGSTQSPTAADVWALVAVAIEQYRQRSHEHQIAFMKSLASGTPELRAKPHLALRLGLGRHAYRLTVGQTSRTTFEICADGKVVRADMVRRGLSEARLRIGDQERLLRLVRVDAGYIAETGSRTCAVGVFDGVMRSPSSGLVVKRLVDIGDEVGAGRPIAVIEAMKMETSVASQFAGVVRHVFFDQRQSVQAGDALVELDPAGTSAADMAADSSRIDLADLQGASSGLKQPDVRTRIENLLLGFDPSVGGERADLIAEFARSAGNGPRFAEDCTLLGLFADLCLLARPWRTTGVVDHDLSSESEYLGLFANRGERALRDLPDIFVDRLRRLLGRYGVASLADTRALTTAVFWLWRAQASVADKEWIALTILTHWLDSLHGDDLANFSNAVRACEDLYQAADRFLPRVAEYASTVREVLTSRSARQQRPDGSSSAPPVDEIPDIRQLLAATDRASVSRLTALVGELYVAASLAEGVADADARLVHFDVASHEGRRDVVAVLSPPSQVRLMLHRAISRARQIERPTVVEAFLLGTSDDDLRPVLDSLGAGVSGLGQILRITVTRSTRDQLVEHVTRHVGATPGHGAESLSNHALHPELAARYEMWRLREFDITSMPAVGGAGLVRAVARENAQDFRYISLGWVLEPPRPLANRSDALVVRMQHTLHEAILAIRIQQMRDDPRPRSMWSRVVLHAVLRQPIGLDHIKRVSSYLSPLTGAAGLEKVVLRLQVLTTDNTVAEDRVVLIDAVGMLGSSIGTTEPSDRPMRPISGYRERMVLMRRAGQFHPYEALRLMTAVGAARARLPVGEFVEYEIAEDGEMRPTERNLGENSCAIVVGVISSVGRRPDVLRRVLLLADPSQQGGALGAAECARIIAGFDLAEELGLPVEWYAASSGARIAMDSGTENLDWSAAVLRRIVEFTQNGGTVNVVVVGACVGAQAYFAAEATMLMHTRGSLTMLSGTSLILTGKRAIDFAGGISAATNEGIGGYEEIMALNGEAQYAAADLLTACQTLYRRYEDTAPESGGRFRRFATDDAADRDIAEAPAGAGEFSRLGEIFDEERNPGRRRPFGVRPILTALVDRDCQPLERWAHWRDARSAIVCDARVGGFPATVIGIEGRALPRNGVVSSEGPREWSPGTLFPATAKKIARALNGASDRLPVVLLANLAGFDASPESMRNLQLEYGAELGRAVVNFRGPILLVILSRYHGGAFVVFSKRLNRNLTALALPGAYASVIGGAPAAAVVFRREVARRAEAEIAELEQPVDDHQRRIILARTESKVAAEYDRIHSIERALTVGSVDEIVTLTRLRARIIELISGHARRPLGRENDE